MAENDDDDYFFDGICLKCQGKECICDYDDDLENEHIAEWIRMSDFWHAVKSTGQEKFPVISQYGPNFGVNCVPVEKIDDFISELKLLQKEGIITNIVLYEDYNEKSTIIGNDLAYSDEFGNYGSGLCDDKHHSVYFENGYLKIKDYKEDKVVFESNKFSIRYDGRVHSSYRYIYTDDATHKSYGCMLFIGQYRGEIKIREHKYYHYHTEREVHKVNDGSYESDCLKYDIEKLLEMAENAKKARCPMCYYIKRK